MENEKGIVKLTRKQLYDEIWAVSVAGVARKYNLNYGKLIATCKVENIPFPSSGYWTKKNMGKDVSNEIVEFSGLEDTEISLITKDAVVKRIRKAKAEVVEKVHTDVTEELDVVTEEDLPQKKTDNIPEWPDGILDYLDETERNKVLEYACNLQISQSTRLHKMLVQYKKDIADYKSKLKEAQSAQRYFREKGIHLDIRPDERELLQENTVDFISLSYYVTLALRRQLWAPFNREGARQRRLVGKYIREHLHVED